MHRVQQVAGSLHGGGEDPGPDGKARRLSEKRDLNVLSIAVKDTVPEDYDPLAALYPLLKSSTFMMLRP